MTQPLAGKRILITRAREQSGRLAQALEALGAEVLRLPTIEIAPPESYANLDEHLLALRSFDWLIVTSANGAAALDQRMQFLKIDPTQWQHLQVAAVGPATAAALTRIGFTVSAIPEAYVGEAVAAMLRERVNGKRILLARAAVARDVIPDELSMYGAEVHVVDAYQTVIPRDSTEKLLAILGEGKPLPDALTFTSSSTVDNFFALLSFAEMELPQRLRAVSIGPVTSQTLRRHGWPPAIEAAESDIAGLAAACAELLTN